MSAAFDSRKVYERELLGRLLADFEPGMVVLADRGFYSYDLWKTAAVTGADLVWRIADTLDLPVLEWLPDGSYRSFLIPGYVKNKVKARGGQFTPAAREKMLPVRVIEYMVTNRGADTETIRLLTTIGDHDRAPAVELAALYQQRWEFELTLDEVETHQMPQRRVLRSRTPELVRQELWALLLTHYAVRAFMREAADDLDLDPDRLSFIRAIRVVRRQVLNQAGFSPSPSEGRIHRDD